MSSSDTDRLEDRDALLELLARYATMIDTKDWDDGPQTVFTDPLTWDFQSVGGPPPVPQPLADVVAGLRRYAAAFEATHHCVTSPRIAIDGDTARIRAHTRTESWLAPEAVPDGSESCWLVVGFYDDEAVRTPEGWRLSRVKLTVTHQENDHLSP
jgi:hypothetical protein